MQQGASFSLMLPPEAASLGDLSGYSFVGKVVVTGDGDNTLYLPFVRKKASSEKMVIDFGDGNRWEVFGDLSSDVAGEAGGYYLENVPYHVYDSPGTYCLTIDNGAEAIAGGTYRGTSSNFDLIWRRFGPLKEVYRCRLKCRLATHVFRSSQFLGFGGVDVMYAEGEDLLCGFAYDPPRILYLPGVTNELTLANVDCAELLSGSVEEVYLPNVTAWGAMLACDTGFSSCRSLRKFFAPKLTNIRSWSLFSHTLDRIDATFGHLTFINERAFLDRYIEGLSPYDPYPDTGIKLYMRVDMTGAQFRALSGWTSGPDAHPWGAEYLRVYATDESFDCRGYWYDETDHKMDGNGVWLDDQDRWIDRQGRYVMPDGVTPAVWHDGNYYKADREGRRLDDKGNFVNWDGRIVSDCGRLMFEDGEFVEWTGDPSYFGYGNILDHYGDVKYERQEFTDEWWEAHPDYEWMGYFGYVRQVEVLGQMRDVVFFYDDYGYSRGRVVLNPPDGRLKSARVIRDYYTYLPVSVTSSTKIRLVGRCDTYGHNKSYIEEYEYYPASDGFVSVRPVTSGEEFRVIPAYEEYQDDMGVWGMRGLFASNVCGSTAYVRRDLGEFDVMFGNLFVSNNLTGEVSEEDPVSVPESGWPSICVGSHEWSNVEFDFGMLEVYDGDVLTHRFVPYMKSGVVVLYDIVGDTYHQPTYGRWTPGDYYGS